MRSAVIAYATFALLSSCGGDPQTGFVAFERDFQDFHSWEAFDVGHVGEIGDIHGEGPRRIYLRERPPAGSKAFPIGTMLAKEMTLQKDPTARTIFAMVKRGAGFNPGGNDWEWFDLAIREDGSVRIAWRGVGPPSDGDAYGDPSGCNPCHKSGGNDMVRTPELALANF